MTNLPFDKLDDLSNDIFIGKIGKASPWMGADVFVLKMNDRYVNPKGSFYPDDRLLRTQYVEEVSWLFTKLRDLVNKIDGYGLWKEDFFGRLSNVANDFITANGDVSAKDLLLALVHEVYAIFEEMQDGEFRVLTISIGNQIAHDLIPAVERQGFLSVEETREFFALKGFHL